MKTLLITLLSIIAQVALFAQLAPLNFSPATYAPGYQGQSSSARATQQFEVSYHGYEDSHYSNTQTDFEYLLWPLNNSYTVTTSPINNTDGNTIRWGAVIFDSIINLSTNNSVPLTELNSLVVDSIFYAFNHSNTSGQTNRVIFTIYTSNATGVSYTNGTNMDFANTLLWRDTITTNTSLTPTAGNTMYRGAKATGGVTIPNGQGYVVRIDYQGPKSDVFKLADGNAFPCGTTFGVAPSLIRSNSVRYYVGLSGTTNFSGTDTLFTSNPSNNCEIYYFQNLAISTFVNADIRLTANAYFSGDACAGGTKALYCDIQGGSGDYSVLWTGPGTIADPTRAYTSVVLPNVNGIAEYVITITDNIDGAVIRDTLTRTLYSLSVNLGPDDVINCGTPYFFNPVASGNTAGIVYNYKNEYGTSVSNATQPGEYYLSAYNTIGCSVNDTILLTSNTGQSAQFDIFYFLQQNYYDTLAVDKANGAFICQGSEILLKNTSTIKNGWSFTWVLGNGTTLNGIDTILRFNTVGPNNIKLIANNGNGCVITTDRVFVYVEPFNVSPCYSINAPCPLPNTTNFGYTPPYDSFPCITQNTYYQNTLHVQYPASLIGVNNIYSPIRIDSVVNLPCGITYTLDNNPSTGYSLGDAGCINFQGTTNDAPGTYKVDVYLGYRTSLFNTNYKSTKIDSLGGSIYRFYLRVLNPTDSVCAAVNTASLKQSTCITPIPLSLSLPIDNGRAYVTCKYNDVPLTVQGFGGIGNFTYSWSPTTGLSCATCNNPIATIDSSIVYKVTVSDGVNTLTDSIAVDVIDMQNLGINIATANPPFCVGTPNVINLSLANPPSYPYTMQLLRNGQVYDNSVIPGSINIANGTFNIGDELRVALTLNNSYCTTTAYSNVIVVNSCGNSNLAITFPSDTIANCPNVNTTINMQATGGTGNYTYTWAPPTGLNCTNCANPISNSQNTITYTVAVNDGQDVVSKSVTLVVPNISVSTGSDLNTCNGAVTLSAVTQPSNTVYWSPSTGLSCVNCINTIANPTNTTTYIAEAISPPAEGSCRVYDTVTVYTATGNNMLDVEILNPNNTTICEGLASLYLTTRLVNSGTVTTYEWMLNGYPVGNNEDLLIPIILRKNDTITCVVTSNLPCAINSTDTFNLIIPTCPGTAIDELQGTMQLSVSPNPSNGMFYISTFESEVADWQIQVFDLSGKQIINSSKHAASLMQYPLDLSEMSKGVYILRVSNNGTHGYKRLVIY